MACPPALCTPLPHPSRAPPVLGFLGQTPVFFVLIEACSHFPHADLSLQSPPCPCPPVLCHCALRHLAPRPLACGGPASGDLGRSRASGREERLGCVVWWKLRCFVAGLSCGPETTALSRAGLAGPGQGPATSCPAPPSRLRWCQALHRLPLRRWFLASVHSALNPLLSRHVWTRSKAGTLMGGPLLERLSIFAFFIEHYLWEGQGISVSIRTSQSIFLNFILSPSL